ncbi:MAG: 50S ribosomal protein L4 [Parcubacteria group bacterium CG_4_9_14_0_2_um_filter_41_8]|nr:MAG: 50S ribosomal protein L4 [Parcubacteria group bacterium CG1_02_41_12]PIP67427.1 MAG: 50S ribosomal protein L4 [Parcubacteria group bacterium CG22_combo_CG10-13_8_21_14_all_41_9]PIQ79370.1 MAG: 50S ribosomal protein L4 [Parcubacteria group bacterium CG11_big_fil_rev_8_21_14_0_20_41_14]PIR56710.1 MAG: 50S ribosomal protein L4 [Parcubacteria group bacterium CG10_big_fil_rev_8_21_14_0_10_41_35]PJC40446.1 MAG: 50S ribosomal protein L4 [Parcubacteria group bacterium CG_4_9_14_0_2_um_filter_41
MPKAKTYNLDGLETGSIDLDEKVFGETAKSELIYQVVRVAQNNKRQPLAHTKMRGEVRGGGRKPWKQKGTGRARHGSSRSPIWKGGGVTFGPRKENITKLSIPVKMRKKALRAVLSDRVKDGKFIIIDDLAKMAKPSTKKMHNFLKTLKVLSKKVLFLSDEKLEKTILSLRNMPKTNSTRLENINILDLMGYSVVMIGKDSIKKLEKQLS